jgi:hypothetical protein
MNTLSWSVLVNLLHGGMVWADAKAFILAYYVPADSVSQTAAAAEMEANKTAGANVVAVGAQAPGDRTASWYVQGAPFENALPSTVGATLPNFINAAAGDTLQRASGGGLAFASGGGGGVTMGPFGSTPNANGATITAGVQELEPADNTHPGGVSIAAQTLKGVKTFTDAMKVNGTVFLGIAAGESQGAIWLGPTAFAAPSDTNFALQVFNNQCYLNGHQFVHLTIDGTDAVVVDLHTTPGVLDCTGLGTTGSIKLKSPDGTVYTLSIANGGTVHIV